MNLDVEQVNLESEDFDVMFGNKVPDKTPSANNLIAAEKPEEDTTIEQETPDLKIATDDDIDTDELLGIKPTIKKPTQAVVPNPNSVVPNPKLEDEAAEVTEQGNEEGNESIDESPVDFKAVTDFLIDENIWEDFEERDKIDYDPKVFSELWKNQALAVAENYFNELVDQSGPYGRAVLDHIKKGGNPEQILELFRENKRIQSLDITTPDSQELVVREYYKTLNWSREKIEKEINRKKEDIELEDEATFAKTQLEERVQKEVQVRQKVQEDSLKEQQDLERKFAENITTTLKTRGDLTDIERKDALKSLLNYDKKLEDGRYVNQFYIDFMKMQADPNSYIDLVLFVKDKNKFLEKASKQAENNTTKKNFNLIKGNSSVTTRRDANFPESQKKPPRNTRDLIIPTK